MKHYCMVCGRQIVSYRASDDRIVGGGPFTRGVRGNFICRECSSELDENGLYPEERAQAERQAW
jgi:hypothetical protein